MNDRDQNLTELARSLLEMSCASRGHFRYESGHHGDLWLQLENWFIDPRRTRAWAAALASRAADCKAEIVCGPLAGGALLAQYVAEEIGTDFVFAERWPSETGRVEYRIPTALHRAPTGRRVLLVDDAINAGSALRSTRRELEACRAQLVAIACLATLGEAANRIAAENQVPLYALAAIERRIWNAERCDLCAAGIPLEDRLADRPIQ